MSKNVRRLYEGFKPASYKLWLAPNTDTMKIDGKITIVGRKTSRPSQRLTFHQNGIKVTAATIIKKDKKQSILVPLSRIAHHKSLDEVRLHTQELLYPGTYEIELTYEAKIQSGMHGIYLSSFEVDGQKKKLVSTQFESHHAREGFPCIDEPEAKAEFDVTLVSPAKEVVLGNMPIKQQTEDNGRITTTFETSPQMSTYLLAFVYGDLQCREAKTSTGVDVRIWSTKAQPLDSLDFALKTAVDATEFYNEYFGTPYPLAKCDHVAIPDFSSGAMENWGLITYRERCLLVDPVTTPQSALEYVCMVICHELSHQWFGNLVTMKWWDDLWLNESFANVMEYVATNHLHPEWNIWNEFVTQEGLAALRRDSIAGVQAVRTGVRHPDEISTLFDGSIVYAKGGRLLHMLMNYVGEEDFRSGLKDYFKAHAYGNTSGDDLWKAIGNASGKDIAGFMNPWLFQSGYPVVDVQQNGTELTITQHHFLTDSAKTDGRLWPVPLLAAEAQLPTELTDKTLQVSLSSEQFVRLNQGFVGHYLVHYSNPKQISWLAQLAKNKEISIADRLMLLNTASLMAHARQDSFVVALKLLEHYINEDSEPVWDIMSLVISDSRRFVDSDPQIEPLIKALVRGIIGKQYQRLGWEKIPGESSSDTKLRAGIIGLGVYSEHPQISAKALELFTAYKLDNAAVPAELRRIVFSAAVRSQYEDAFNFLIDLDQHTTNVDLKQDILGSTTATRDSNQLSVLLARLKDQNLVRLQDVDHWLINILTNRFGQQLAWDWLRDNWQWLEQVFGDDKSYDYLPRYAATAFATRQRLKEYVAFFDPLKDQPALTRNISIGIEELTNRVKWVESDLPKVQEYFKPRQS